MIILLLTWIGVVSSARLELNVHPADKMDFIWKDTGSGVTGNVAIYRSHARPGYYRVGDVAVAGDNAIVGYLVRPTDPKKLEQILQPPVSYCAAWNDRDIPTKMKVQV